MNKYGLDISNTKKTVLANIAKIEEVSADFDKIENPFTKTSLFIEGSLGMNGKIDGRPKIYSVLNIRDSNYKLNMRFTFRYSLAKKSWKFDDFEINYSRNWWTSQPSDEIYKALWQKVKDFDFEGLFKKKNLKECWNILAECIVGVKGEEELSLFYKNLINASATDKIKGDF